MTTRMPSVFISHGAPSLVLEQGPVQDFLRSLSTRLPARPTAIICASAHWPTAQVQLGTTTAPAKRFNTIHDFGGFPAAMYALRYPALSAPALAEQAVELLNTAGIAAALESERGLDHGVWVPLSLAWPDADVPVIPLSVQPALDGAHHLAVGRALAGLRDAGVLVIGSGSAVHNLAALGAEGQPPPAWASAFMQWLLSAVKTGDIDALANWRAAPFAARNHPTPEHFLPLLVAAGAGAGPGEIWHHSFAYGSLAMTTVAFP